jgi:uncharacterized BrkB/YihY/UPF0761 family membrane protein
MPIRSRVINAVEAAASPGAKEDSYWTKVVTYIPGEIVAAYLAAFNALKGVDDIPLRELLWGVSAVLLVLAPFWTLFAASDPDRPRPYFQAGAAAIAFAAWVFAMPQGPFSYLGWYRNVYGTLALIFFTLVIPLLEKMFVRAAARSVQTA